MLARLINGVDEALRQGLDVMRNFLLMWISALILLEGLRVWGAVAQDGRKGQHAVGFVVRTLMAAGIFWGWPSILKTLVQDAVHAGLVFGGAPMSVEQFLDPGWLMVEGFKTAQPLYTAMTAQGWITGTASALFYLIAWVGFIACYCVMGAVITLVQIELHITLPLSMLALGFFFWGPTRSMASGVLSYGLNSGLRFFLYAIMATLVYRLAPVLTAQRIGTRSAFEMSMEQGIIMVLAAVLLMYLFLKVPSLIMQHLGGGPSLGLGGFMQTVAGAVGVATGIGGAALPRITRTVRPTPMPAGVHARRLATGPAPGLRIEPPRPPTAQALTTTLRTGAHFLGPDPHGHGPQVSL
jgi:type IV secretory pathway TrbL component